MPADILKTWREAGTRGVAARTAWEERFATLSERKQAELAAATTDKSKFGTTTKGGED